jgi:hypothetical protein
MDPSYGPYFPSRRGEDDGPSKRNGGRPRPVMRSQFLPGVMRWQFLPGTEGTQDREDPLSPTCIRVRRDRAPEPSGRLARYDQALTLREDRRRLYRSSLQLQGESTKCSSRRVVYREKLKLPSMHQGEECVTRGHITRRHIADRTVRLVFSTFGRSGPPASSGGP